MDCTGVTFTCNTDPSLGASTDVFAWESNDVTSDLADDEAILDLTQDFTAEYDPVTQCCINLLCYILTQANQTTGSGYVQMYIRIYQIVINTQFRVKKVPQKQGSGGGN